MLHRIAAVFALLFCLLACVPALAQTDAARTVQLIGEANAAYDGGDYMTALQKYREAYVSSGEDARVLYRIGMTYENLKNYQRAREHFELFLLADPKTKYAERVRRKISNLTKLEQTLQSRLSIVTAPSGANVWVDVTTGRPAGVTPVELPVGPGRHTLVIQKEGFNEIRVDVEVGEGQTVERSYDLGGQGVAQPAEPPPAVEQPAPAPPPSTNAPAPPEMAMGPETRVFLGPSRGTAALAWLSIAAGWGFLVAAGIMTLDGFFPGGLVGGSYFVGGGLVVLGGYLLWFRNYRKTLPPAATTQGPWNPPPHRAMGLQLRF